MPQYIDQKFVYQRRIKAPRQALIIHLSLNWKNTYALKGLAPYQHYTVHTPRSLIYETFYQMDPSGSHLLIESDSTAEIYHP